LSGKRNAENFLSPSKDREGDNSAKATPVGQEEEKEKDGVSLLCGQARPSFGHDQHTTGGKRENSCHVASHSSQSEKNEVKKVEGKEAWAKPRLLL